MKVGDGLACLSAGGADALLPRLKEGFGPAAGGQRRLQLAQIAQYVGLVEQNAGQLAITAGTGTNGGGLLQQRQSGLALPQAAVNGSQIEQQAGQGTPFLVRVQKRSGLVAHPYRFFITAQKVEAAHLAHLTLGGGRRLPGRVVNSCRLVVAGNGLLAAVVADHQHVALSPQRQGAQGRVATLLGQLKHQADNMAGAGQVGAQIMVGLAFERVGQLCGAGGVLLQVGGLLLPENGRIRRSEQIGQQVGTVGVHGCRLYALTDGVQNEREARGLSRIRSKPILPVTRCKFRQRPFRPGCG